MAIRNLVVISDLHSGCRLALCPPEGANLDDGGHYTPSAIQKKLWKIWTEFWDWVKIATKGEPYAVAVNGDVIDGVHHRSTTQISHNLGDQEEIAYAILQPIRDACGGRFYMVRGTEAHVGPSSVNEESLAKRLQAIPNEAGQRSHYKLNLRIGSKRLIQLAHHVGTTTSMAYETTAGMKELAEIFADCARWNTEVPDIIVRSHRHRHIEIKIPTAKGYGIFFITACWQLRTPFSYRIAGGRIALPQFGGSLIRYGDRELFTEHFVRTIADPEPLVL